MPNELLHLQMVNCCRLIDNFNLLHIAKETMTICIGFDIDELTLDEISYKMDAVSRDILFS